MKIIFLDFDGVLNSIDWMMKRPHDWMHFDPRTMELLNGLVKKTQAEIVVSSSWRIRGVYGPKSKLTHNDIEAEVMMTAYCKGVLDTAHLVGAPIGATPTHDYRGYERGYQIQRWMEMHPEVKIESFVILDDSDDMVHLMNRLVRVPGSFGLQEEHVELAIKKLNEKL